MMRQDGHIWFLITLIGINGEHIASWPYDSFFPVVPPRFTYENNDYRCCFSIQFQQHLTMTEETLPAGISLNRAIDDAVYVFSERVKKIK